MHEPNECFCQPPMSPLLVAHVRARRKVKARGFTLIQPWRTSSSRQHSYIYQKMSTQVSEVGLPSIAATHTNIPAGEALGSCYHSCKQQSKAQRGQALTGCWTRARSKALPSHHQKASWLLLFPFPPMPGPTCSVLAVLDTALGRQPRTPGHVGRLHVARASSSFRLSLPFPATFSLPGVLRMRKGKKIIKKHYLLISLVLHTLRLSSLGYGFV